MRQNCTATGLPVVLAGDYNVVPTDADIYPSKSWAKDALLQPASRARRFARLLAQGWTDAVRARHPTGPIYTFWDYKRDRWARDAGLRIDHLLLSAGDRRPPRPMPASTARCAARMAPATMRRRGPSSEPLGVASAWRTRDANE